MEEHGSSRGARIVLVAVVAVVVALLVVFVATSGGGDDEGAGVAEEVSSAAEAGFDEQAGQCVGAPGPALSRCRTELSQAKLALKNAATAEELHSTSNTGAYTDQISDLEAQGFSAPPAVLLKIVSADKTYCIESSSEFLAGKLHYDSAVGSVEPGPCPSSNQ